MSRRDVTEPAVEHGPQASGTQGPFGLPSLPSNVWVLTLTSFLTHISSEMLSRQGWGPSAPFSFGAVLAAIASLLLAVSLPQEPR